MLVNVGPSPAPAPNRLLATVAWRLGGDAGYALEGAVFIGGAAVQWLRDGLGLIATPPRPRRSHARVDATRRRLFVPAFAGLGAPHWDPDARGLIAG